MDRDRLNQLLQQPTSVEAGDVAGLRELAGRYPWFSGAQLLLAVGEAAAGDILFDEHLRTAAVHLPSRARVHDLVHAHEAPAPRQRATPVDAGPLPVPVAPEMPNPEQEQRIVVEQEPTATATPELPSPPAVPTLPVEEVGGANGPQDDLDVQIRSAALASLFDLELEAAEPAPRAVENPAGSAAAVMPIPDAPADRPARMRFTAWLEVAPVVPARPVPPPTPKAHASPPAKEAAGHGAMDASVLIDRFIQGQSPPPGRKAEFFTPQAAAKRSLEEHAELVTETLARIYEQQGDLARAAAAYRRLADRHPKRREEFLRRAGSAAAKAKG